MSYTRIYRILLLLIRPEIFATDILLNDDTLEKIDDDDGEELAMIEL